MKKLTSWLFALFAGTVATAQVTQIDSAHKLNSRKVLKTDMKDTTVKKLKVSKRVPTVKLTSSLDQRVKNNDSSKSKDVFLQKVPANRK